VPGLTEGTMGEGRKFSAATFLIKLTSRAFWVWVITTAIVVRVIFSILSRPDVPVYDWTSILLGIWGLTAVLFLGGNVLIDALGKAVEKASVTLNTTVNASANTNISGTVGGKKQGRDENET